MNYRKALSLAAATAFAASAASVSIAEDAPVLALSGGSTDAKAASSFSRSANNYVVDFMPSAVPVAGVNFDVIVEFDDMNKRGGNVSISDCAGSVSGSHVARCEMVAPDRLRVLVFSAPVSELPAASLVSFSVNGQVKGIRIDSESTAVSDLNGGMIQAEIL